MGEVEMRERVKREKTTYSWIEKKGIPHPKGDVGCQENSNDSLLNVNFKQKQNKD